MFKNNSYKKNKNIIAIPKHVEKHDVKNEIKPNVGNKNYENIRNIVENNDKEIISNSYEKPIKKVKYSLNKIIF